MKKAAKSYNVLWTNATFIYCRQPFQVKLIPVPYFLCNSVFGLKYISPLGILIKSMHAMKNRNGAH